MTATGITAQTRTGLRVQDLTVRIPVGGSAVVHAVTEMTLAVPLGEVTALVGESGCGKSMVAAAVAGTLPANASVTGSITVRLDDRAIDLRTTDIPFRGRHVALVPQSPTTYFTPVRTLGSQLRETVDALGSPHTCAQLLDRAGLPESALRLYPHELSGGMAQRAAIAAALAGDAEVIIADEPSSSLDRAHTDHILRLLRTCADNGAAVLLITHDLSALSRTRCADTLAVMYASHLVETGPAPAVLADPWHDYTRDLLAALPERGLRPLPHATPGLTDLSVEASPYLASSALIPKGQRVIRERRP